MSILHGILLQLYHALTSITAMRVYGGTITCVMIVIWVLAVRTYVRTKRKYHDTDPHESERRAVRASLTKQFVVEQIVLTLILLIVVIAYMLIPNPQIVHPALPLFEPLSITHLRPLAIQFDRPIPQSLRPTIIPEVNGTWEHISTYNMPLITTTLQFTPAENLLPETEYYVEITDGPDPNAAKLRPDAEYLFSFKTPPLATVTQTIPSHEAIHVFPDTDITIVLSGPESTNLVDWSAEISPAIPFIIDDETDPSRITIIPQRSLSANTSYSISLWREVNVFSYETGTTITTQPEELVTSFTFTTTAPETISDIKPSGEQVLPSTPLSVTFNQQVDHKQIEALLSIQPETDGRLLWVNDRTLHFTPRGNWQQATTYEVSLSRSSKNTFDSVGDTEFIHRFTTIGDVAVKQTIPEHDAETASVSDPLRIIYNQPVRLDTLDDILSISPRVSGKLTHESDTIIFTPYRELTYDTTYTVTLTAGARSLYNTSQAQSHTWSFHTQPAVFKLDVPLIKQRHDFTCFVAGAQMALAYYDIEINENQFMDEIGYDTTPRNFLTNTWGNPYEGIVGTIDGTGPGGYGAHWGPVSDALSKYRPVEVKRGLSIPDMLKEVRAGNPVIVWWVNGIWPARDVSWFTPTGQRVYTVNGMHVNVVTGWEGDINDPIAIYTNDPSLGARRKTPEQFLSLWRWFDNTAVIVR